MFDHVFDSALNKCFKVGWCRREIGVLSDTQPGHYESVQLALSHVITSLTKVILS